MREIKFRGYVKAKKKVLPVYSLDFSFLEDEAVTIADCGNLNCGLCLDYYRKEDVELMQYTGLKDKNGVEIYEGDILTSTIYPFQSDKEYNYHGEVRWGEEDAAFLLTKHIVNKDKRGISHGITDLLTDYDIRDFEIIGNIYTNPELLQT